MFKNVYALQKHYIPSEIYALRGDIMCCDKCKKLGGGLLLVFGILFLLQNLNVWSFWNIQPWTVLFVLGGLSMFCTSCCPMCQAEKKKK
jgi:hypothetical protein